VLVISNVLDSLSLSWTSATNPTPALGSPPPVTVGSSIGLYPFAYYANGSYAHVTNAEYVVTSGTADVARCQTGIGAVTVQAYCANLTPRAAGTITVQARLRKSDGGFWTSTLTFTAR
jgi:hypothetical protein